MRRTVIDYWKFSAELHLGGILLLKLISRAERFLGNPLKSEAQNVD